jgi:predicted NAD-dependent protein-ADP-ribosyltransferase YbiA (DUF1768 family)
MESGLSTTVVPFVLRSGFRTEASRITGFDVNGYNWKQMYQKQAHLKDYAAKATSAVIASLGTFSNDQREPIKDPMSGQAFKSAEQMFHFYKFPSTFQSERHAILQCQDPESARKTAQSNFNASNDQAWNGVNKQLMVFIQLTKALKKDTGLLDALNESGDAFIIEDTSKRQHSGFPEKTWGDNGDGTGENWLGWAQMEARSFIQSKGGALTAKEVQEYFRQNVSAKLEEYYTVFNA